MKPMLPRVAHLWRGDGGTQRASIQKEVFLEWSMAAERAGRVLEDINSPGWKGLGSRFWPQT